MAFSAVSSLKKQYTGNGKTGPFVYDKYITPESNFRVIKTVAGVDTDLVLDTDYTLQLVKSSNGAGFLSANITLTTALETDETLTVESFLTYNQSLDLVNGTVLNLDSFEAAMDKSALLAAQLSTQLSPTLKVSESSTITNTAISELTPNFYLRVNSAGTSFETVNVVDLLLQSSLTPTLSNFIVGSGSAWTSTTPTNSRTALGLGSLALQSSASVTITGGLIQGITDLSVTDGGTGASDASTARDNLGLTIGTNVQAYSADLAGLAAYNTNGLIFRTASGTYVGRSIAGSTGFTITNGSGVSGNPSIAYNIGALTEETSPLITDTVLIRKSTGDYVKTQIQNLPSYSTPGAPAGSSFITLSSSSLLTSERVLSGSNGLLLTDGGANSTITASVDINGRTLDASPDVTADYTMSYDASASTNKKVLLSSILGLNRSFTLIQSQSFSGVTSVNFTTGINSTYNLYVFTVSSFADSGTSAFLGVIGSNNGGSSYVEGLGSNLIDTNSGTTTTTNTNVSSGGTFYLTNNLTDTYTGGEAIVYLFNPSNSAGSQAIFAEYSLRKSNGTAATYNGYAGGCFGAAASAINAIQFQVRSTSSGRITLYGVN